MKINSFLVLIFLMTIGYYNGKCQQSPERALRIWPQPGYPLTKITANDHAYLSPGIIPGCLSPTEKFCWIYFTICDSTSKGDLKYDFFGSDSLEYAIYGPFSDTLNISQQIIGVSPILCTPFTGWQPFSYQTYNYAKGIYYIAARMIPHNGIDSMIVQADYSYLLNSDLCNICNGVYNSEGKICLVSVDSATQKNRITIDKGDTTNISGYILYRENSVNGFFDSLAFIPVGSSNYYIDNTANPQIRNWRYLLHKYSICGDRLPTYYQGTGYSYRVNTIHLQVSSSTNNYINLSWNNSGNPPVVSSFNIIKYAFYIYRSNGVGPFQLIDSLPFTGVNSYTDVSPNIGLNEYKISIKLLGSCDTVNFGNSESFSNKVSATITGQNELNDQQIIRLFPNPVNNIVSLKLNNRLSEYQINVRSIEGKLCISSNGYNSDEINLDLSSLGDGFYQIELVANKKRSFKKVLVNHTRID